MTILIFLFGLLVGIILGFVISYILATKIICTIQEDIEHKKKNDIDYDYIGRNLRSKIKQLNKRRN